MEQISQLMQQSENDNCYLFFAETVVGESVVVIKKLLQMQVWSKSQTLQCILESHCSL